MSKVTPIVTLDIDFVPVKRGAKPQNIDDKHIEEAIRGRDAGEYVSAENAAYRIAVATYKDIEDKKGLEAFRKALARRLAQQFRD
ncbi:hypothetical protein [uncultured Sphingomonas sp.]|uniref:hypothetical protein n=1 Tax=uncultured Sphingomonas sp. TaxID=158754 RepID=UPI0025E5F7EB|nr:hypothetical protein [uncultured Sphingomonas sp.]